MKDFENTIRKRYSCRAYTPDVPSGDIIDAVLDDCRLAPSACNRQPWRFIVVSDEEGKAALRNAYSRPWFASAPMYIVVCAVPGEAWVRPEDSKNHADVDASIATEHLCLSATAHGLATCWVCNFEPTLLREGLSIDAALEPIAIIPIGYAAPEAKAPQKVRKALNDIVIRR